MTLSANDLALIQNCDTSEFEAYIAKFAAGGTGLFLSAGHPFQSGIVVGQPGVVADRARFRALSDDEIKELTFARAILHSFDGWSYLARALAACAAGDAHRVRHFGYYAELRAALSMLAAHGIGVFDRYSAIVDRNGAVHHLECGFGTHKDTWLILEAWAKSHSVRNKIADAMSCLGHPISDCLTAFFASPGFSFVGNDLFGKLGFDLAQGSKDRNTRNSSSYGPTFLTDLTVDVAKEAEVVTSFWRAFAPSEGDLDRHLLRLALELEIETVGGDPISLRENQYDFLPDDVKRRLPFSFLTREIDPSDHLIIRRALDVSEPAPHLAVLCRGAVLLRISTQLIAATLRSGGIDFFNDMQWFWDRIGIQRGFWRQNSPPEALSDLWMSIELAVTELEQTLASNADEFDRVAWLDRASSDLPRLSEAERAGLWSLSS